MTKQTMTLLCIVFAFAVGCVRAEDWPCFRGPGARGASEETDLPLTWSQTKNLLWKTPLPGAGSSSPIIVQSKVFATCYSGYGVDAKSPGDPRNLRRHLVCVAVAGGRLLWDQSESAVLPEVAYAGRIQEHGYASSTPVSDGEYVYVFFGKSGVLAFDLAGKKLWQRSVGVGSDRLKWGSASSPMLCDDMVIVNAWDESQTLYALSKKNGNVIWAQDLAGAGLTFSTPVLAQLPQGRRDLVLALPGQVWGLDPATGERLWSARTAMKGLVTGTPVVIGNVAYIHGGGPSGRSSVAVRLGGSGDVTSTHVLWENRQAASVPSPVHHDGLLYWVNNDARAHCQDIKTGELKYREKLPITGGFAVYASLLEAGGKLYAVTRTNGTFVLDAKPDFKILAHNELSSDDTQFNGSPAVVDGRMFLRSDRFLYCITSTKGN